MEVRFVGNVVDRELLICCSFGKRVRFVQVLGGYLISEQMYVFFIYFIFLSFFQSSSSTKPRYNRINVFRVSFFAL